MIECREELCLRWNRASAQRLARMAQAGL
jgi:hypothetical protein